MISAMIAQVSGSNAALITFVAYTLVVFALAFVSSRMQKGKSFLSEYFLGSRNIGMWAFALTFAATAASGGSFTGFPSLIYSHGWVLALWIASYMLAPVVMMGLFGKRMNQVARKAGAITVPDVLGARFGNWGLGAFATILIIFFMTFNLVAQFKAGAMILSTLLDDTPMFRQLAAVTGTTVSGLPLIGSVNAAYLLCLLFFAFAVIVYTSYGGFRAVVWTDVLQGVVMVFGVILLLPMTLYHVGGLRTATLDLAAMVPPQKCSITFEPTSVASTVEFGEWVQLGDAADNGRLFRVSDRLEWSNGDGVSRTTNGLEIMSPHEVERIANTKEIRSDIKVASTGDATDYAYGRNQKGVYVSSPGPSSSDSAGFLPLGVAISFFFFWTFSGAGQPSNMVRLMSFNSSQTLRRAIITVAIYFSLIYFPLVIIFCCGRVLLPGMEIESDRIMPALAEHVTRLSGVPWLAGLLVAAPFAAVMSTVDSFLLMISSAMVRDVYQRAKPDASEANMKRLTYLVTILVGVIAFLGALNPPKFLQDIIVFTSGGLSACFLIPVTLSLYWRRFNGTGALGGMIAGFVTHVALYAGGFLMYGHFRPIKFAGFDPFIPELIASMIVSVTVCLVTAPPPERLVRKFFLAEES